MLDGIKDHMCLALHGGFGEDGGIQSLLSKHHVRYNGSCEIVSQLGMDKYAFSKAVNALGLKISALEKGYYTQTTWKEISHLGSRLF